MSLTSDALRGVAQHLEDAGIGTWSTTTAYVSTDTAVALKALPTTPDRAIAVSVIADLEVYSPQIVLRVQITTRESADKPSDAVDDLADDVIAVMHGVRNAWWGALWVSRCSHFSTAPLGADEAGRQERSDNFRIITTRPGGTP